MKYDRRELKYYAPLDKLEPLRERFLKFMEHDPHCKDREGLCQCVRSVYFDTPRLLFYHEKLQGLKVRKKLRVRVYNFLEPDNIAFLEIKRKIDNTVFKERARVQLLETPNLTNGVQLQPYQQPVSFTEMAALEKFTYLIRRLNLQSSVLVTYEREALIDLNDPALRVTFDLNVRSYPLPKMEEIFRENDLSPLLNDYFILEVKFNGRMPVWVRNVIRDFNLRVQAISKYCNGIDAWWPVYTKKV